MCLLCFFGRSGRCGAFLLEERRYSAPEHFVAPPYGWVTVRAVTMVGGGGGWGGGNHWGCAGGWNATNSEKTTVVDPPPHRAFVDLGKWWTRHVAWPILIKPCHHTMIGRNRMHFCLTLIDTLHNIWQQKVANFQNRQDQILNQEVMCVIKV